jgi:hypothetical protein
MDAGILRQALAHIEVALRMVDALEIDASGECQLVRRAETELVYASQALEQALAATARHADLEIAA